MKSIPSGLEESSQNNYDYVVRNIFAPTLRKTIDIGIIDGKFVRIGENIPGKGAVEFNGVGFLATPPFIDSHAHLDKAFYNPSPNLSGTLGEALKIFSTMDGKNFEKSFIPRVERALYLALKNGTLFIRTHIDICNQLSLKLLEILNDIKKRWENIIDIQVVAFPQNGFIHTKESIQFMRRAMRMGADIVGGIPALEKTPRDSLSQIVMLYDLATEFNRDIDMHIDETDDANSRTLEMLADVAFRYKWEGRVAASHCCSLNCYDDNYAKKVIEKVSKAGISVITNPSTNLSLQGRSEKTPVIRGITKIKELIASGVTVTCGHDNLQDVFYPFGQEDMLETVLLTAISAQMTGIDEIDTVFNMPLHAAAKCLGIHDYGILEGNHANLVIIPADGITDLIASRPPRSLVMRNGKILCKTDQSTEYYI